MIDILKNKFELSKNKILEICNKNKLIYDKSIITKDIPITDFFVLKDIIALGISLMVVYNEAGLVEK